MIWQHMVTLGQGDGYTAGYLLDYTYYKKN